MRPSRLLLAIAALALASCARRYPVEPGPEKSAVSGLPVDFGEAKEKLPDGTTVSWDFGDGSRGDGQVVRHAFPRAGDYRVKLEVKDGKGVRAAETLVHVARRPPEAAVPPTARTAIVFDRLFARLPRHLAVLERFFGPERTSAMVASAKAILRFDPTRPEEVLAAGLDPEEGFALVWLPGDEAVWAVLGTTDDKAAQATVEHALADKGAFAFSDGPFGSRVARAQSVAVHFLTRGGYLYVRLPGRDDAKGAPAIEAIAKAADEGLFADPAFARARLAAVGDDLVSYHRARELPPEASLKGPLARLIDQSGGLLFSLADSETELRGQMALLLAGDAKAELDRLFAAPHRLELLARAPAGASAVFSTSASPELFGSVLASGDRQQRAELDGLLRQLVGLDAEQLISLFDGDLAAAIYFDAAGLLRDLLASGAPTPKFNVVALAGLKQRDTAAAALGKIAKQFPTQARAPAPGSVEMTLDGQLAGAVIEGDTLLAGYGDAFKTARANDPAGRRLEGALADTLPKGALAGPHLFGWVDVAGVLDSLRHPPAISDVPAGQLAYLQGIVSAMLDDPGSQFHWVTPVRDVSFRMAPGELGLVGTATVRIR